MKGALVWERGRKSHRGPILPDGGQILGRPLRVWQVACVSFLLTLALSSPVKAREIGPESDLCTEINRLPSGDELVLRAGEYQGPCVIRTGGTARQPLVVRAKDPDRLPRIIYQGTRADVLGIAASHVTIRGLAFGPTRPDVDAIRVLSGDYIVVENCEFEGVGGIAVAANHQSSQGLTIRRNRILNNGSEAVYIGCHNGITCMLDRVLVEGNFIHGVDAHDPYIGYGIQIKLNSWGWIRDNVIEDTKGPGIMVYGATAPGKVNVIDGNAVSMSRSSAAIVVGGGPAVVRNNIVTYSAEGGIRLEDYGQRDLLRNIVIAFNSIYNNFLGGITLQASASVGDIRIINNAVHARPGTPPYPEAGNGIVNLGNVNCSLFRCFRDPERGDFSPALGSPLNRAAIPLGGDWVPRVDFAKSRRGKIPVVGALEGPAPRIPIGSRGVPQ